MPVRYYKYDKPFVLENGEANCPHFGSLTTPTASRTPHATTSYGSATR